MSRDEALATLRRVFPRTPPDRIAQAPFDGYDSHLKRLARLGLAQPAEARDLWDYSQDLRYCEIDQDFLKFALPFCLRAWREDLLGDSTEYRGFVEHLYPVLADRKVFEEQLTVRETAAVAEYMRATILEEIDQQRGLAYAGAHRRPYRWIAAFSSYGVLRPDIEQVWRQWWPAESLGRAIAVVQFASCLIYPEKTNPVFSPWTPDRGGGPPLLWEYAGHLYEHCWKEENVLFLKRALTPESVRDALESAATRLEGQAEYEAADRVRIDAESADETLDWRCFELAERLAERGTKALEWSR